MNLWLLVCLPHIPNKDNSNALLHYWVYWHGWKWIRIAIIRIEDGAAVVVLLLAKGDWSPLMSKSCVDTFVPESCIECRMWLKTSNIHLSAWEICWSLSEIYNMDYINRGSISGSGFSLSPTVLLLPVVEE